MFTFLHCCLQIQMILFLHHTRCSITKNLVNKVGHFQLCHQFLSISYSSNSEYWSQKLLWLTFIGDHSKKGNIWIKGTSLTLSSTKRGTDLGMLVVPFNPFTRYIYAVTHKIKIQLEMHFLKDLFQSELQRKKIKNKQILIKIIFN